MTIKITLNEIKSHSPCKDGWENLLKSLNKTKADSTEVTFSYIAETNSVSDALWCLRVLGDKHKRERLYLIAELAESVAHIYNKKHPNDNRVNECIQAVKDYADNKISLEDLRIKRRTAADAAANAAAAAADAAVAYDAADAAVAYDAADAAAAAYAYAAAAAAAAYADAAAVAAVNAAYAADAAADAYADAVAAVADVAAVAVVAAERGKQKKLIKKWLG
jgi:hypothetical protein